MSSASGGGAFSQWYRNRIGESATDDEIRGYWVFVAGVLLGVLGILLFLPSSQADALRQWSIVGAAVGLTLLVAGPLIRLPLRRMATVLVYVGALLCVLGIVWFVVVFPNFRPQASLVIGLYSMGILVMALGGVFVPLISGQGSDEPTADHSQADADEQATAQESQSAELQAEIDELRQALQDAEADEEDLAARLRTIRQSQARFELFEDRASQYRWRLRHRNGNVIADSGEGYTQKHNAQKGMQSVRRNAIGATVLHIESEAELPDEGETFEPVEETESQATFELYEDRGGEHRFRLRHDNGNILGDSGEGYSSRGAARTAIDRLQDYVGPADYLRFDPTGFEIYRDTAGEWRWRLVHQNGNILGDSGEGYSRRRDARRAIERIRDNLDAMEFEVYEDAADEYRWRLLSSNGQIMADSGEGYTERNDAQEAADRVEGYVTDADLLDVGDAAFELYDDQGGEWRWRLRHRNGNILADSGQGYNDRSTTRDGIESVKRNAPNADVTEE